MADVVAIARAAIGAYTRRHQELLAGIEKTRQVLTRLTAVTTGSTHPAPRDARGALEQSRTELEASATNTGEAIRRLTTYLTSLESGGDGGSTHSTGTSPRTDVRDSAISSRFDPKARNRQHSAAIKRFGWPKNQKGTTQARGILYDGDGKPVLRQPLKALAENQTYDAAELKEPWRSDRDMKTSWHIEGGAAAYMRITKTHEMSLWLNVPACGGYDRPDPKGCHENLRKILPPTYTLHVHVEEENGWYRHHEYHGTGEALK